jgi:large subunit ribosomal protein L10
VRDEVLQQKEEIVQEIADKLSRAQAMVLVDYRGLNVAEVTDLRSKYRAGDVDYKVYKNTMMRRALEKAGIEGLEEHLTGPNAVAFSYDDPAKAAKITRDFAKENDKLVIKAGMVDGAILDIAGVESLAKLPSKEVLVAQVLGTMNAPIQGLATVLNGTISGLARCLDQIRQQQETAEA